jgi:DNA-binding protein H-NS
LLQIYMARKEAGMAKSVERMSLRELQQLSVRVNKAMVVAQERDRAALRQKMESLASHAGFRLGDLFGRGGKGAKYANPSDPTETWTGRGRKPKWLVAKLKTGDKIERFLIK